MSRSNQLIFLVLGGALFGGLGFIAVDAVGSIRDGDEDFSNLVKLRKHELAQPWPPSPPPSPPPPSPPAADRRRLEDRDPYGEWAWPSPPPESRRLSIGSVSAQEFVKLANIR